MSEANFAREAQAKESLIDRAMRLAAEARAEAQHRREHGTRPGGPAPSDLRSASLDAFVRSVHEQCGAAHVATAADGAVMEIDLGSGQLLYRGKAAPKKGKRGSPAPMPLCALAILIQARGRRLSAVDLSARLVEVSARLGKARLAPRDSVDATRLTHRMRQMLMSAGASHAEAKVVLTHDGETLIVNLEGRAIVRGLPEAIEEEREVMA